MHDGVLYHHVLSPRTGMPIETEYPAVSVICERSIDAEGYSTTLLALGAKRGRDAHDRASGNPAGVLHLLERRDTPDALTTMRRNGESLGFTAGKS